MDAMREAYETTYPSAAWSKINGAYQGIYGGMWTVWQAAVASCAPAAVEQVDALTDEQIKEIVISTANEIYTNDAAVFFAALCRAVIVAARPAAPVQPGTQQPFAYISHDAVRALEKIGKGMVVPKSFVLRKTPSGSTTTPIYLEPVAAPAQGVEQSSGNSGELLDGLQEAATALQKFKADWMRVPHFADRVNKTTRNAISMAIGPMVNLDAVGGPLDLSKYARPAAVGLGDLSSAALAKAQQSEDARDAARYRWFRDQSTSDDQIGSFSPYAVKGQLMTVLSAALDLATDAAIAALTGSGAT